MILGYAIALGLCALGAVLVVVGLLLLRAEQRAKAVELKAFLTTGAIPATPRVGLKPPPAANADDLPALPVTAPQAESGPSEALIALRRAYEAPMRRAS